jgi:extradiol dioxygenase family protein
MAPSETSPDYRNGPCRLTSFLHLEALEDDPQIKAMHGRHLDNADGTEMHGHQLVAELVETLNKAAGLTIDLAFFHAIHNDTGCGDPVLEWKRLAIQIEQQIADQLPCQVRNSLEATYTGEQP